MLQGAIGFLIMLANLHQPPEVLIGLIIVLVWLVPAYYAAKRRKWGWIVFTILSLNPVLWVINWIYGSKRWGEFQAEAEQRHSSATAASI
jgi:hypothetical protein